MTKAEAKREACFIASLWIDSNLGDGAMIDTRYSDADAARVEQALKGLSKELERRGWRSPSTAGGSIR